MSIKKIQRALISVWDKSQLETLLRALQTYQVEFISTGGSGKEMERLGVAYTSVEQQTQSPAILDGRVKTLHPMIFGAILGRDLASDRQEQAAHKIEAIDLVVVNLYPFTLGLQKHPDDLAAMIELIDIGGVSLLRAAAKNYANCVVVASPNDYAALLEELALHQGGVSLAWRERMAAKVFALTARYDSAIADYLGQRSVGEAFCPSFPNLERQQPLAYGENPHQRAALYQSGLAEPRFQQLSGKELSYNNLLDLEACVGTLGELSEKPACVIVKHANPCGVGWDLSKLSVAYERALSGDPVSAFGGVIGLNRPVDADLAEILLQRFYEVIVAPGFTPEGLAKLQLKAKLRLIQIDLGRLSSEPRLLWRDTLLGTLVQERDREILPVAQARVVTAAKPTSQELAALDLAWRVCKWVKSNAIVLANDQQTVGIGAGQMSRVDSVGVAVKKAVLPLVGCALASDAFFPFRDNVDLAHAAGIRLIVQPGGSIRDQEVIDAANEHGIVMLFTGQRHFRH